MSDQGDLFELIEKVLSEREAAADSWNLRSFVTDVFKIADSQQPGAELATRDVYKVLFRTGRVREISSVSRMISQLEMVGALEYTGKKPHSSNKGWTHAIPMYRLVK